MFTFHSSKEYLWRTLIIHKSLRKRHILPNSNGGHTCHIGHAMASVTLAPTVTLAPLSPTISRCSLCQHVGPSNVPKTFTECGPTLVIDSHGWTKEWARLLIGHLYWMRILLGATRYALLNTGECSCRQNTVLSLGSYAKWNLYVCQSTTVINTHVYQYHSYNSGLQSKGRKLIWVSGLVTFVTLSPFFLKSRVLVSRSVLSKM